jgi:serine protease Do
MMARWSVSVACLVVGGVAGGFVAGPMLHGDNPAPPAVPKELTSYRDVVKRVMPAVVSVEGKVKPKVRQDQRSPRRPARPAEERMPDELRRQIPEEFRKFFEDFGGRIPFDGDMDEVPAVGFGSGFLIDPKGLVLTNYHVVAGADQVEVQLKDGRKFTSRDIHGDSKSDLAVVRLNSKQPLPYLELGDSSTMEIGDRVLAVGAPFRLAGTVTQGIVSAKGRNRLNISMYEDFIQTDAAINPGNSGGPLVNLEGKVIGINSAIKSRTGGFQGIGLAISSNMARNIVKALETDGVVHRGYLGVEFTDLTSDVAEHLGLKDQTGVVVGRVMEGSPADRAHLQAGDVVTRLNGKEIHDGQELRQTVVGLPLNKPVELTVVRDGKTLTVPVTIEEQPENFAVGGRVPRVRPSRDDAEPMSVGKLGLSVKDVTPEAARQLGFKEESSGALIARVTPDSPAAEAGLRPNMLITRVDKDSVTSAAEFQQKAERAALDKGVLLQVQTPQGGLAYVVVKAD